MAKGKLNDEEDRRKRELERNRRTQDDAKSTREKRRALNSQSEGARD